jgi:hypothetical protein
MWSNFSIAVWKCIPEIIVYYNYTINKVANIVKNINVSKICIMYKDWQDSSGSTAMGYGLDGQGLIPFRDKSFLHSIQTSSGAHPASYPVGTGVLSPGAKSPGREADHSPPSNAKVKNGGAIPPLPYTSSWCGT